MSTLASHSAQNLNFGISVVDIRQALETATSRTVSKLSEIASIPNSQPRMRGNDSTERVAIPESAIVEYIKRVRDEYPELKQALTRELATMRGRMKEMRAGEARIPRNLDSRDADIIYEIQPQRKSERKWYFRNEKIKQSEIETLDSRLRDLAKLSSQLQNVNDPTSLLALLWKYGPKIDTRQNGSVGFLDGCTVVKVLNGHDVMVTYNEVPYLVNLDTTVGLWIGHQLTPVPAFVNGTSSYHAVDGNSTTITLIQSVSKNQIERVLSDQIKSIGNQSPSESAGDGETKNNESIARKWRDRTSSFSVDAVLVEVTKSEVVLRKSDGKIVRVPRDKLSDEDQKHLTEIEKLKK